MKFWKRKSILWIVLGFTVSLIIFSLRVKDEMVDFEVNYRAGARLKSGETLYRLEDGHYQFKYSPFSALLYLHLSFLPLTAAKALWFYLILISILLLVILCRRLLRPSQSSLFYTLVPLMVLARYFLREAQLGQINAFLTLILVLMVWALVVEENRPPVTQRMSWAGILWGLATALKPYAVIFFPYLVIRKRWKPMAFGMIFLGFSLIFPSLFYGFSGNMRVLREWVSSLSRSTPALLDSQDNISILGLLMKWTGSQKLSLFIFAAVVFCLSLLLLVLVLRGKGRRDAPVLDCSILLVLIPLLSPLGWDYTLLMSFLGVMICFVHFLDYSKFWRACLILNFLIVTFSLYDLLGKALYAQFMSLSVITLNFLILIGYLSFLRWKGLR